jgi:hypothetical protein
MKKETYGFSTKYQDVDFLRIVEENKTSDFILVEWANENGKAQKIILVTPRGVKRCKAVGMYTDGQVVHKGPCEIKPNGDLWRNTNGPMRNYVYYINVGNFSFSNWFSRLREREERNRPIKVTAIS